MAESDKHRNQASPEVQLFARVRLQRVVFGAFAIVLVCLFALGLSFYRRMQADRKSAQQAAVDADVRASEARKQRDRIERELQETNNLLGLTRRQLALEKCRLAMHEIRSGQLARARTLLEEAQRLGAPAWAPLVARLTREQAVRFSGSEHEDAPILCGAMSADDSRLAVLRKPDGDLLLEIYGASDGKLQRVQTLPGVALPGDAAIPRLLLNEDASAWYLTIRGHAYYGTRAGLDEGGFSRLDTGPLGDDVSSLAANADLSVVYEAAGAAGLIRRTRMTDGNWLSERVELDLENPEVLAVCLDGDRPVIMTPAGIYLVGGGGLTGLLKPLDARPVRCALHYGAGAIYAALLNGRALELVTIKTGETPHVASALHEMPDEEVQDLIFLRDDTPVWVGRSGRIVSMSFSAKESGLLGGYNLTFIQRHAQGWVFGNRKGELSVRTDESFRLLGRPLHLVPPQFVPEPRAHGFVLRAPGGETLVLQGGQVRSLGSVVNVALAPQGAAWVEGGTLRLPTGQGSEEHGTLLGAFADGRVLLFSQPQKLKHVGGGSVREFLLPGGGRAPDPVVLSAQSDVVAFRMGAEIFVSDMLSNPAAIAGRTEVEPNLMVLDATGACLAIAYGPTVVVHDLRDSSEHTVRSGGAPKRLALLFGGSVLVTLEGGELVLYEVATGRELIRAGSDVSDLCASGESSVRLVAGSRMFELKLQAD